MLAISMCLLEKYLAKIRMTTILSGSTGSMEKNPKSNQLAAPLTVCPKASRTAKKAHQNKKTGEQFRLAQKSPINKAESEENKNTDSYPK